MRDPRSILITGASSGIGAALARVYAAPGTMLRLMGRHAGRLRSVADACAAQGAEVETGTVDVTDAAAMRAWIADADRTRPIDLAVANAGIAGDGFDEAAAREVYRVSVEGMVNTIGPLLDPMIARRRGHLALMSSLAGFRGLGAAPAYCGAKAAVRVHGEGLRAALSTHGVEVSVICPGFVRTAMTEGAPFPMPLLMEPDRAARIIARGIGRNRARIAFPRRLYLAVRLLAALPPGLGDRIAARRGSTPP